MLVNVRRKDRLSHPLVLPLGRRQGGAEGGDGGIRVHRYYGVPFTPQRVPVRREGGDLGAEGGGFWLADAPIRDYPPVARRAVLPRLTGSGG